MTHENRNTHPCPRCGKMLEPSWMFDNSFFVYSWRRADLPYFLCGDCRVAFVDKRLLRACISTWRETEKGLPKRISFREACAKAKKSVENTLHHYRDRVGYKIVLYKKPKPVPP